MSPIRVRREAANYQSCEWSGNKGVSESGNKAKKQEEQESGSDDDFQTAVTPLTY